MKTKKAKPLARLRRLAACAVAACAGLALAGPGTAAADFEIANFEAPAFDKNGDPELRAGAHPHVAQNVIEFTTTTNQQGFPIPDGNVKDVIVDLPPGFGGNPQNVPQCAQEDLLDMDGEVAGTRCAPGTVVGTMVLKTTFNDLKFPVHNMEPPPGVPAQFAFVAVSVPVFINASVRPDDHGLRMKILNNSSALPFYGTELNLWGVPASSDFDMERISPLTGMCIDGTMTPCPSGAPHKAFMSNGSDCSEPQVTRMRTRSWQDWIEADDPDEAWIEAEYEAPPLTECDALEFEPQIDVQPSSKRADTPSGYRIELTATNNSSPTGRSTATLDKAVVTLPEGTAINPSVASGLEACSPEQIGLGTDDPIACPEASKIGTVELDSPLQSELMTGSIYLAEQDNNPFGSTLAVYLTPAGGGVQLKLPGEITTDPDTGQLVTTFDDNPQLPFDSMVLEFKGGQRAPLVNPPTCGTKSVEAEFTAWSGTVVSRTDSFEITQAASGGDCPATPAERPFEPGFDGGVATPAAGAYTPFVFRLTRPDGHQELLATEVVPPEGVTANMSQVPLCDPADAEIGACDEASKVGRVEVGVGAGANPYYVEGSEAYLAGPFDPDGAGPEQEAPLSLAFEVPAVAGPLDLGTVNVRAAVYVDKTTAQLRVVSEELPTILEGIPLRIRDLRVLLDRPEFTIAPTSCEPTQVTGEAVSVHGQSAELSRHFQVAGCGSLPFAPSFSVGVAGEQDVKRNAHPELTTTLATREGDANLDYVRVTLPDGMFLDHANLANICTRPQYEAGECPEESRVGYAVAETPILPEPLEGPVYLRSSDNPLPDLVADLNGLVEIDLVGVIDQNEDEQRIRTTFATIPDVPVGTFTLTIEGGEGGLLVNSRNMCRNSESRVAIRSQANHRLVFEAPLEADACAAQRAAQLEKRAAKLRKQAAKLAAKAKRASGKRAKRLRARAKAKRAKAKRLAQRAAAIRAGIG